MINQAELEHLGAPDGVGANKEPWKLYQTTDVAALRPLLAEFKHCH